MGCDHPDGLVAILNDEDDSVAVGLIVAKRHHAGDPPWFVGGMGWTSRRNRVGSVRGRSVVARVATPCNSEEHECANPNCPQERHHRFFSGDEGGHSATTLPKTSKDDFTRLQR